MKRVSIITLGCKVNKNESDQLAYLLAQHGYLVADGLEVADYYIINSCAVTNAGERKSRQVISKITKQNKNARILLCGCASQNNKEQFLNKPNVAMVIGTQNKERVVDFILEADGKTKETGDSLSEVLKTGREFHITNTRAYLKIQDGCNRFCSYCIIPYLRGRSTSRDINQVVAEAEKLATHTKEIVLVGIDISDYKVDGKPALHTLVERLSKVPARFRFGSFEVSVVTDKLLKAMKTAGNFVEHFHLSLQSGDDEVLKNMNRKYTTAEYYAKCQLIRQYFANANITTDIIVGYPTETEEQFVNTLAFVERVGFGRMHIFPFSVREGTPASKLKDLPKAVKHARYERLSKLGERLSQEFYTTQIGQIKQVLLETENQGIFDGYTENYIKTYIKLTGRASGQLVKVKMQEVYKDGMLASLVECK